MTDDFPLEHPREHQTKGRLVGGEKDGDGVKYECSSRPSRIRGASTVASTKCIHPDHAVPTPASVNYAPFCPSQCPPATHPFPNHSSFRQTFRLASPELGNAQLDARTQRNPCWQASQSSASSTRPGPTTIPQVSERLDLCSSCTYVKPADLSSRSKHQVLVGCLDSAHHPLM